MAFSFELKLAISSELYGAISAGPEHDGVLNNAPTMSELEAKAKAGEQISLFDVAEAAKAEARKPKQPQRPAQKQKKPSIRAQLKAAKEEQQKKPPQREKTQELEV